MNNARCYAWRNKKKWALEFKMAAVLGLVKLFSHKRKAGEQFLSRQYKINKEMAKKRFLKEMEFETEALEPAVMSAIVITKKQQKRARSR